jgi:enoyl-CoA hydratase/carnithine racemase
VSDAVLTEAHDSVLVITLNRPDAMNAIDTDMARGLLDAVQRLDSEPGLAAGVLTGAGRGFCSGLDLKAFAASGPPKGLARFLKAGSNKPLIAAIEGVALAGGLEIALTCDLLIAARDARFGIPEARVGLFAAGGALFRLPQRIPYGVALEMALTGAHQRRGSARVRAGEPPCRDRWRARRGAGDGLANSGERTALPQSGQAADAARSRASGVGVLGHAAELCQRGLPI